MPLPPTTEEDVQEFDLRDMMRNTKNTSEQNAERGWDVGPIIAKWLVAERQQRRAGGSIGKHVNDEEDLADATRKAVTMAANNGQQLMNLQAGVVTELNTDRKYRAQVERVVMVYASLLYPLSYLLYRLDGTENIFVQNYDNVLVLAKGKRYAFRHVWDELAKEGNTTPQDACKKWFDDLLHVDGVGGDNVGLSQTNPRAEATFGSIARVTVVAEPALAGRATLQAAIRIHGGARISDFEKDYVQKKMMDAAMAEFLIKAIQAKANILVSGSTDTGKTTFIRVATRYFPKDCILVTIEDGPELYLDQKDPNGKPWVPFAAQLTTVVSSRIDQTHTVSLADLVRNALRFRPDRIIVGEARGGEMAEVVKALTTGHDGSMTSLHAYGGGDAIAKGAGLMTEDPRYTSNFDHAMDDMVDSFEIVVHLSKFFDRRVVQEIMVVSKQNVVPIYQMTASGAWLTMDNLLDNIPNNKLRDKLKPFFPDGFLPKTEAGLYSDAANSRLTT